jgi:hypothetical protein
MPASVGNAIRASVDRSNSPTGGDTSGGFHEEGFTAQPTGTSLQITNAPAGLAYKPGDSEVHVTLPLSSATTYEEHVHPAGTTDPSVVIGGTQFTQEPKNVDEKNSANAPNAVHMVAGAGSQEVYSYNASGVQAKVPKCR